MASIIKFSAVVLSLSFTLNAHAFRFSPIYATLTPEGKGKSASFTVENPKNEKMAIQIGMFRREVTEDGTENNPSAKELFNVYPEQFILEPGATRKIRVTWLGKEKADKELAFRLLAEQLDVDGLKKKTDKKAQIKILMSYKASLYVEPANAAPDLVVEEATVAPKDSKPKLKLVFHNKGTKHKLLLEPVLDITFKDQADKEVKVKLEGKALEAMSEHNVLPGNKRLYELPWSHPMPNGPLAVQLTVKNEE